MNDDVAPGYGAEMAGPGPGSLEREAFASFLRDLSRKYATVDGINLSAFEEPDLYELVQTRFGQLFKDLHRSMDEIERKGDNRPLRQHIMKNDAEMAALCYGMYLISYHKVRE